MRNYCVSSLIAGVCLFMSGAAGAATIVVNTTADVLGTNDGICSLRGAVRAINMFEPVDGCVAGDGNDTITFAPELTGQTIVLNLAGPDENNNETGDLDILPRVDGGSLVITGPGTSADSIIIDGGAQAGISTPDRIFHIIRNKDTALVEFSNLTLRNGAVGGPSTSARGGGAILAENNEEIPHPIGLFRLNNVVIANNTVQGGFGSGGGGVFVDDIGTLEIIDSVISGNTLTTTSPANGGGFYVRQVGPVSIASSDFSDNSLVALTGAGGGFAAGTDSFSTSGSVASVTIDQSQFIGNSVTTSAGTGADFGPDAMGGGVALLNVSGALTTTASNFATNTLEVSTTTFSGDAAGGGLYVSDVGQATVTQTEFNNNSATVEDGAARGGGVYIRFATAINFTGGGASNNKLTTVLGDAQVGGNTEGGGLWTSFGDLQIDGSVFSNNKLSAAKAMAHGGGMSVQELSSLGVNASEFSNNTLSGGQSAAGGGVWVGGVSNTPAITSSEFASNDVSAPTVSGGGLFLESSGTDSSPFASISVVTTRFTDNRLTATARDARGSGLWLSTSTNATATIRRSEFSRNRAATLGPLSTDPGPTPVAYGSGLYIDMAGCSDTVACVQLQNSTLSGNALIAQNARAGGAGLFVLTKSSNAIVGFNNVTVANNAINADTANGGGFAVADSVRLELANSLIATNNGGNSPDCATSITSVGGSQSGTIVSRGFNLVGNPSGCSFTAAQGDLLGNEVQAIDPMLGALGDNGGATRTHALLANSPAIDVGNPDTPTGVSPNCMSADQRGSLRPQDGNGDGDARCDIGALERAASANAPPTVDNPIDVRTLQSNDDQITIDLSTVFSDPENGPLTYSAVSSNPASVLASTSGAQLIITPVADGVVTVDVTATDQLGATATDSLTVIVANQAPVIDNAIPNQSLSANGSPQSFDLSTVFSDPDNDPLTFTVESDNPAVVTAAIDGNLLTISPGQDGNATISVTATDDLNAAATDQFDVNVEVGNQPPNIISPISDQTERAGGDAVTFDLSMVFADPDKDALTFTATSSDPQVVTAELQGSSLTLTPVAKGNVSIDVTASDPSEAAVTDTLVFVVTEANRAPVVIAGIPDQNLPANSSKTVDLTKVFEDPDGDTLYFFANSSNPNVVSVEPIGSDGILTLTAGVPGSATVTVTAQDTSGTQAFSRIRMGGDGGSNAALGGGAGGGCVMTGLGNGGFDPMLLLLISLSLCGVVLSRRRRVHGNQDSTE